MRRCWMVLCVLLAGLLPAGVGLRSIRCRIALFIVALLRGLPRWSVKPARLGYRQLYKVNAPSPESVVWITEPVLRSLTHAASAALTSLVIMQPIKHSGRVQARHNPSIKRRIGCERQRYVPADANMTSMALPKDGRARVLIAPLG